MSDDFLKDRKESLVEEFFRREEVQKKAAYKAKLEAQRSREELRKASSITDDELLDKLVEIGVTADTVAAMSLVPLVHVAWADGSVKPAERDAVLRAAEGKGIEQGSPAFDLLSTWLEQGEPPNLHDTWSRYIRVLCEKLNPEQQRILKSQIVGFARSVAEAAGGFLGLKKVSAAEEEVLEQVEAAFSADGGG